jgi:hypothetical protein
VTFKPGDDVIVTFDGRESPGVVLSSNRGHVMAQIETDPEWDYGTLSSRLAPHSIVCVKEGKVRVRLGPDSPGVLGPPES